MAFYTFRQNNSGGSFSEPALRVIVEASSTDNANVIAQTLGVYFDGCDIGRDCPCCGDRWSRAWDHDCYDIPSEYGEPVIDRGQQTGARFPDWGEREGLPTFLIAYADGRRDLLDYEGRPYVASKADA